MMLKWFLGTLLLFFTGCGTGVVSIGDSNQSDTNSTSPAQSDRRDTTADTNVTTPVPISAGEDQSVLVGTPVTLFASRLDQRHTFTTYRWKEGDRLLCETQECSLLDLPEGVHRILLEAVDTEDARYTDTVTVTVTPRIAQNSLPRAVDLHFTTQEDTTFHGSLRGNDADGDPLRYLLVSLPEHGKLSGSPAHLHYTPDPDFSGEDRFYFKTNDGKIDSALATVTITVEPVNDAPQAEDLEVALLEDGSTDISLKATDKEGDSLSYTLTRLPEHGSVTLSQNRVHYTPQQGYFGRDSFGYKANDGFVDSKEATVYLTIDHVNHAPQITPVSAETSEDTPLDLTLAAADRDAGDTITYRLLTSPRLGSVTISGNRIHYVPSPNAVGTDTFTYVANDGTVDSNHETITVTIDPVNDLPVVHAQQIHTPEDQPVTVTLDATDVDGDTLTYRIDTPPMHGTVSLSGNRATYTPDANYFGSDRFSWSAADGTGYSRSVTVDVEVTAVNDRPVVSPRTFSVQSGNRLSITLTGSDVDGDTLTFSHDAPAHGRLEGSGADLTYTPDDGFTGTDTFTYRAYDGASASESKTVTITVTQSPNQPPQVSDLSIMVAEDSAKDITLSGSDADGDTLSYRIVHFPQHGTVSLSGNSVHYIPEADYNGIDRFDYVANDGRADSDTATVSLEITPQNDRPIVLEQSLSVDEDNTLLLTLLGSDIDGDTLTYQIDTPPAHGTVSCNGTQCTYRPDSNYFGNDSFTFKANDGQLDSDPAQIAIHVIAQNDIPVATGSQVTLAEDNGTIAVTLLASDIDGDTLTPFIVTLPVHGNVTINGNQAHYTPDPDFFGTDRFSFKVNDGRADSNIADINLTVTPVNDTPVAQNLAVSLDEDSAIDLNLSATDVDDTNLTYTIETSPAHGNLSGTAPQLRYTPDPDFYGTDSFTYTASDGESVSAPATVTITVNPVNDAPVADAGADMTVAAGDTVNLSALRSYDPDGTIQSYEWKEGTQLLATTRDFNTTFAAGSTHTITLTVTDDQGVSASDTIRVNVTSTPAVSFTRIDLPAGQNGSVKAIFISDIDTDGDTDLIVISDASGNEDIGWYRNDGNLNFSYMGTIRSKVRAKAVAVGNLNGDIFPDIVYGDENLTLCYNNADVNTVSFTCQDGVLYSGYKSDDNVKAIVLADIDGQNGDDIVVATDAVGEHKILFYPKDANATFDRTRVTEITDLKTSMFDFSPPYVVSLVAMDNDNDGDADLAFATNDSDVFFIETDSTDKANPTFTKRTVHTVTSTHVFFSDIDGDRKLDLVSLQSGDTFQWNSLDNSVVLPDVPAGLVTDMDMDGFTDIVPDFTPTAQLSWYRHDGNNANPSFDVQTIDTRASGSEITAIGAADLDNAGDHDIDIVVGDAQGNMTIYRNDTY